LGNLQYPDYEFDVEALVDTGFDGGLTVPQALIPVRVAPMGQQRCDLADGSLIDAPVYRGFVTIGSLQPVSTYIIVLPHQALLGRAVTNRFRLSFLYGRQVVLEP
jgi:predicted aspartyl protease